MFSIGLENQTGGLLAVLAGGAAALALGWYRSRRAGIGRVRAALATVLVPLFCCFFSHLLYCLVDLQNVLYTYSMGYFFAFWQKGYMVYGGILGAALALLLAGGRDAPRLLEQYAPGAALMLAAVRIGEGLMGQGYGEYAAEASVWRRFPFMVYDAYYEEWCWALFMLEALVALVLFFVLLKKKKPWQGDSALLLMGLYASAQIVLESLRRDEFLRWGFVRVEELVSAVVVVAVIACYCVKSGGAERARKALCISLCLLMITLCVLLEFATEGRIDFLTFLSVDACYIAMAFACAVMAACVLWMRCQCNVHLITQKGDCRI